MRMARVLALSSHVAFGSVGLAVVVPALHWLGHEAMALPTVVLSNHPGYPRCAGENVPPAQIMAMLDALESNGCFTDTAAVITGYLPTREHVGTARSAVERVRRANPEAMFLCDPVFGDVPEGLYLPDAVASAIRDQLLPLADIATPNQFELSWLTGRTARNPAEARDAARVLHTPAVLATSIPAAGEQLANVLVTTDGATACSVKRRPKAPHGTGDLLAAVYLGWLLNGTLPEVALAIATAAVDVSVAFSGGGDELPLAAADALWASLAPLPTTSV
jgi:pyridoxine kinase